MTAQIRPNRMEVSDRFPMLGFAVRAEEPNVEAEVVLATDIALFQPQNKTARTAANFYSSREHGTLAVPRGDGIFVVPPEVLARFIGQDRLFFGLATGRSGNGGLKVDALPREGSPYVSLRGFTGRTLRRSFGAGRSSAPPTLDWTGDAPRPGSEPANGGGARAADGNGNGYRNGNGYANGGGAGAGAAANGNGAAPAGPSGGGAPEAGLYDDGFGPMPEIPAQAAAATSRAMIITADDVQQAQAYAPQWADLFNWAAPASVVAAVTGRGAGFVVQRIQDAAGALNLDQYEVHCTQLPSGWTAGQVVDYLRQNINSFLDTRNTEFLPYAPEDATLIASASPLGAIWKLDIAGPDNAAVVVSASEPSYFRVTTIETPETGSHPVSGHREWGYTTTDAATVFYTRAADRSTHGIGETLIWAGADHLWRSLQDRLAKWINANGGAATVRDPFSQRFHPEVVRILYGAQAQSLAARRGRSFAAAAADADSPQPAPGAVGPDLADPRARARRIGGAFADRIGEALDLGLAPTGVAPLLDVLDPPAAAQPLPGAAAMRARARSLGTGAWTINWDDVELVPQPSDASCWAAAAAMVVGWRDRVSLSPETLAQICARTIAHGLDPSDREAFAADIGLETEPPMSYAPEGFRQLIETRGPLWVSKLPTAGSRGGHAVVATGMYFDGTDHFVRVADPWDRVVGAPGAPGAYAATHATGSRYIMRYDDFQTEYEMRMTGKPPHRQILHAGGAFGHTLNTGQVAPPPGFAMAAPAAVELSPPPPRRARAMDGGASAAIGAAVAIGGILIESIRDSQGDVTWELDQFRGLKHPNDAPPPSPGAFHDGPRITLEEWPVAGGAIDDISAWFRIDWQYDGLSLGNVRIVNTGVNDAVGWGLHVRAQIMDDNQLYAPNGCAALRLTFHYRFSRALGSDQIAIRELKLFGNGTWEDGGGTWTQASALGVRQNGGRRLHA